MKVIPMQTVFQAVAEAGKIIGHDGATIPVDVADVMPDVCHCNGSGHLEVRFGGQVIARPACPVCARG